MKRVDNISKWFEAQILECSTIREYFLEFKFIIRKRDFVHRHLESASFSWVSTLIIPDFLGSPPSPILSPHGSKCLQPWHQSPLILAAGSGHARMKVGVWAYSEEGSREARE